MGLFDWLNAGMGADPNNLDLIQGGPDSTFADRFAAARPQGVPPVAPNTSPISPEALAANAAARGIPPPPTDFTPPVINPGDPHRLSGQPAMDAWRANADVGSALTGNVGPPPLDIRTPVQQAAAGGSTDLSAQARGGSEKGNLAEALKGVKMPVAPEIQKLGTPSAPRVSTAIKGGQLVALLQALNAAPGAASLNLPSTLGAAIRR